MFKKVFLVSALVVTFCFGLVGTAMAESVVFDEAQIAAFEQAQAEQRNMAATESMSTPDSNVKGENTESKRLLCASTPGYISNLDSTTEKQDALEAQKCASRVDS